MITWSWICHLAIHAFEKRSTLSFLWIFDVSIDEYLTQMQHGHLSFSKFLLSCKSWMVNNEQPVLLKYFIYELFSCFCRIRQLYSLHYNHAPFLMMKEKFDSTV